ITLIGAQAGSIRAVSDGPPTYRAYLEADEAEAMWWGQQYVSREIATDRIVAQSIPPAHLKYLSMDSPKPPETYIDQTPALLSGNLGSTACYQFIRPDVRNYFYRNVWILTYDPAQSLNHQNQIYTSGSARITSDVEDCNK
ncbi:hypothetical protein, partial [Haloarcula marismortui]|uniref:hypothetical protein n=1 Tax=Haloarcula marismortui TaxID=2238 RepID=UPI001378F650